MKYKVLLILSLTLLSIASRAQTYINPVHLIQEILYNNTVSKFDNLSEELEKRADINDSINTTLTSLLEMKKSKVSSMADIPQYYTDPVRIKRFLEKVETTRKVINYSRDIMQKQGKYHYFEVVMSNLEDKLEEVEANWQIVTEFKGKKKLMDAHQRYKIALYAEKGLQTISRDAINYSRIAQALTRSPDEAAEKNKEIMNTILQSKKGIE